MIKGMWSNNVGDAKIEGGGQIYVFKILNGHEKIELDTFVTNKTGKITRGCVFALGKGHSRLGVRNYSFSRLHEWNKLPGECYECNLVVAICLRTEHTLLSQGQVALRLLRVDSR